MYINLSDHGLLPHATTTVKVGDIFGRLTIEAIGKKPETYRYMAVCNCSCGTFPYVTRIEGIKAGTTTSCGCAQRDATRKHGNWNHRLYPRWRGMMQRCYMENSARYKTYGARGITVCPEWHDINVFIKDMYPSFVEGLELDRRDVDGNYNPDNCRWIPHTLQASNKTSNISMTLNGKTQCMQHWATETGIIYGTLWERVKMLGWTDERALTTPVMTTKESVANALAIRWGNQAQ